MSVFSKNECQYSPCKRNFRTLSDLIVHIENDHIDFDPRKIEQLEEEKPECIPLSYVLKFSGPEDVPQPFLKTETVIPGIDIATSSEVVLNNNYIGCDSKDFDERLSSEELTQILSGQSLCFLDHNHKKPFACSMKGCEKRYKNINGIKYHYRKHHNVHLSKLKKNLSAFGAISSKMEKRDLDSITLYSYDTISARSVPDMRRFEDCRFSTYYKTEIPSVSEVPLPNLTFNYYNINDSEENVGEFSGRNPNLFPSNFDKY